MIALSTRFNFLIAGSHYIFGVVSNIANKCALKGTQIVKMVPFLTTYIPATYTSGRKEGS